MKWLMKNDTIIKPEYSNILYNPTYFPDPSVCRIRQVPLYIYIYTYTHLHMISIIIYVVVVHTCIYTSTCIQVNLSTTYSKKSVLQIISHDHQCLKIVSHPFLEISCDYLCLTNEMIDEEWYNERVVDKLTWIHVISGQGIFLLLFFIAFGLKISDTVNLDTIILVQIMLRRKLEKNPQITIICKTLKFCPIEVCGFLWVLRFPPPIKLTATI
jgi:hypothetical protein